MQLNWPGCIPFSVQGLNRLAMLLGVGSVLVTGLAFGLRCRPLAAGGIVVALVALAGNAAWPLLVTAWFWIASMLVGAAFTAACGGRARATPVAFLIGAAFLGTIVGLSAHLPINNPATFTALLLAPCLIFRKQLQEWANVFLRHGPALASFNKSRLWLEVAVATLMILHVTTALMPEVLHDPLAYHLFIPAHIALRGSWGFDATMYAWAVMPMLGDWLFAVGYMLGAENGARLMNCLFILTLASLIRELVLRGGGGARGAAWAVILFLSSPLTFTESSSLFVESVWACYVVAGGLVLIRAARTNPRASADVAVCGVLFGAALAAKAWSLVMLPAIAAVAVIAYPQILHPRNFRGIAVAALSLLAIGCVPYVTAWRLTGNPVFPFYNGVFKSDLFPLTNFTDGRWKAPLSWRTLYGITFDSSQYMEARNGIAGFAWLTVLPAASLLLAVSRNRRGLAILAFGVSVFAAVFSLSPYLRYVFPAQALLLAAVGIGVSAMPTMLRPLATLLLSCVAMLNCLFLNAGPNYAYNDFPVETAFSARARTNFIETKIPMRKAVAAVNELNAERKPVAFLGSPLAAGLAADALYSTWYNQTFQTALAGVKSSADLADILETQRAEYLVVQRSWGTPEQRAALNEITTTVLSIAGVDVKRVQEERRYTLELLTSTGNDWGGWNIPACVEKTPDGGLVVGPCNASHKAVAVIPGKKYRNAVTAHCSAGTAKARTQVIWHDAQGQMIRADGEVFDCGEKPVEHVMVVKAPENATHVVVFAAGHTKAPVIITRDSLCR
jgi:hypothetical protein